MGKKVVIVSRLMALSQGEAKQVVAQAGDQLGNRVTADTALVVIGGRGPHFQPSGQPIVQLARARRLAQQGKPLRICNEQEWLESIGVLAPGVCHLFTAAQLADTLGISRGHVERWSAAGLLQPVEHTLAIPLYDFRQVTAARMIAELSRQGVRLARLRCAVNQLAKWLPETQRSLANLGLSEDARHLMVRTENGAWAELSGQLLFDFDSETATEAVPFTRGEDQVSLFQRAVSLEETQPLEAIALYRQWLQEFGPHPTVAFNLANALYAVEDLTAALAQYRQVVELEPLHASAWNNLANILAELDELEEALEAYRRALSVDRRLIDARFNLAQTLVELDRRDEAVLHWRAYLAADEESTWADYAREFLAGS